LMGVNTCSGWVT